MKVKNDFQRCICQSLRFMATPGFQDAFPTSARIFKAQIVPLLALFAVSVTLTLNLEDRLRTIGMSDESTRWQTLLVMVLWELFEGILLIVLLSWGAWKAGLVKGRDMLEQPFDRPYLGSFVAEYFRMLAQTILFGLLFLIPGYVRYCQLAFVPFVAMFSKRYEEGETDALAYSRQLTRPWLFWLLGLFLLAPAVQFLFEQLPQLIPGFYVMPFRAFCHFLSFYVSIWIYSLVFGLFREATEKN